MLVEAHVGVTVDRALAVQKSRREENSEATRRALIDAALELFTAHGYQDTPTEAVVKRARVTRGALYHHFEDKQDLFRAVAGELNAKMAREVTGRALGRKDVWSSVMAGVEAFLDVCLDPGYQRIIVFDGPAVFGVDEWRAIAEQHGLGIIRSMVGEAMRAGIIDKQPAEPLAYLLHGAFHEAAIFIARADDRARARQQAGKAIRRLLEGLLSRRR